MLTFRVPSAGIQHLPREGLRAHPGMHRRLRPGQDLLHPQWECSDCEAELPPWFRVGAVGRVSRVPLCRGWSFLTSSNGQQAAAGLQFG